MVTIKVLNKGIVLRESIDPVFFIHVSVRHVLDSWSFYSKAIRQASESMLSVN